MRTNHAHTSCSRMQQDDDQYCPVCDLPLGGSSPLSIHWLHKVTHCAGVAVHEQCEVAMCSRVTRLGPGPWRPFSSPHCFRWHELPDLHLTLKNASAMKTFYIDRLAAAVRGATSLQQVVEKGSCIEDASGPLFTCDWCGGLEPGVPVYHYQGLVACAHCAALV
jgi:hypothetical protein